MPVIRQHVLALIVQNGVKQCDSQLYDIQPLEYGQDMPGHLVLDLPILNDNIGGE